MTKELQKRRAERLARLNAGEGTATGSDMSSLAPSLIDDDRKSLSSESFMRTSQLGDSTTGGDASSQPKRNKTQLWNEVKITCKSFAAYDTLRKSDCYLISDHSSIYSHLHVVFVDDIHPCSTQSPWPSELSLERHFSSYSCRLLDDNVRR